MPKHLKFLFFLIFTQGIFQVLGVPNNILKLVLEGYLIFIFFRFKSFQLDLGIYIYLYIIIAIFSSLLNDNSIVSSVLYTRYHLYAFLIFSISKSYNWKLKEINDQFRFMKKLFVLQVLYAFYEIFI